MRKLPPLGVIAVSGDGTSAALFAATVFVAEAVCAAGAAAVKVAVPGPFAISIPLSGAMFATVGAPPALPMRISFHQPPAEPLRH